MINVAPFRAILEQSLCPSWYSTHDLSLFNPGGFVEEQCCKIRPIQAGVAVLRGWKLTFDTIPGTENRASCGSFDEIGLVFIVAIPYGKIADQIGRKTVFVLSIVGLIAGTGWILVVCMYVNAPNDIFGRW